MMRSPKWLWVLGTLVVFVPATQGQGFDGMLDRLGDRFQKKVEREVGDATENAVDTTIDKATGATPAQRTKRSTPAPVQSTARCTVTDSDCLREAQRRGQVVEIVTEAEANTVRCSATDTDCLKRAQELGKRVEITD